MRISLNLEYRNKLSIETLTTEGIITLTSQKGDLFNKNHNVRVETDVDTYECNINVEYNKNIGEFFNNTLMDKNISSYIIEDLSEGEILKYKIKYKKHKNKKSFLYRVNDKLNIYENRRFRLNRFIEEKNDTLSLDLLTIHFQSFYSDNGIKDIIGNIEKEFNCKVLDIIKTDDYSALGDILKIKIKENIL